MNIFYVNKLQFLLQVEEIGWFYLIEMEIPRRGTKKGLLILI